MAGMAGGTPRAGSLAWLRNQNQKKI